MINAFVPSAPAPDLEEHGLTPRQQQILNLAAQGMNGPQIAERLGLCYSTVRSQMKHIYCRLKVHNRSAAVAVALRRDWLDLSVTK
jgi:DNA-binding NarL/FixJ family response regulator